MEKTWPGRSDRCHFNSLPLLNPHNFTDQLDLSPKTNSFKNFYTCHNRFSSRSSTSSRSAESHRDFSALPYDVLAIIAATFSHPNLRAASLVCRAWRDALQPLREAMLFLRWGKRFKHGRGGVRANLRKALDSFLKGAARGSTLAMVDAGLVYWEMGKKEEGIELYRRAAALGDLAGQCNLGISCLKVEPPNPKEAVKWLYKASVSGHVRAQYQLARCLHQGHWMEQNLPEAVLNLLYFLPFTPRIY